MQRKVVKKFIGTNLTLTHVKQEESTEKNVAHRRVKTLVL